MTRDSTLQQLTRRVLEFSKERDWEQFHSPRNLAMAISVEANELLELYLWCQEDGQKPLTAKREDAIGGEAADILMLLLNFCHRAGIDLDEAFDKKLSVAALKYPRDRVKGSALKYNEYPEWSQKENDG